MRRYRATWLVSAIMEHPFAAQLKSSGVEPALRAPSDLLRRQARTWIIPTPRTAQVPKAASEEIGRIVGAQNLQALIVVTPGPNSKPEEVAGNRLRRLPGYVQGWGFSTTDGAEGIGKPV